MPTAVDEKREGILSWSVEPTNDKQMAIIHIVAVRRSAFDALLNDKRPEIRAFEIGKHGREEIEGELKKYEKDRLLFLCGKQQCTDTGDQGCPCTLPFRYM